MSSQTSLFAAKATRVAAPPPPQQQQQPLKSVQTQPAVETARPIKPDTTSRGATPVQLASATPAAVAEAPRGATPVNASRRTLVLKSYPELKKECEEATAELAKVSEQLKSSNDARFKLKAKLEEAVSCKAALEEAAQTEQQRLSFALEEMRAEMEVLKAIYQEELDAAKRAAAENTRTATMQLGEQAEDALARLSSAHTKLEAAEKRLESLGVDAVSLQRFNALEVDKENELTAFADRIHAATASLHTLQDSARDSLLDAKERNEQLERLAEWFESSNELEAPAGFTVSSSSPAASRALQSTAQPSPATGTRSNKSSPATSSSQQRQSPMPTPSPRHLSAAAASPTVFSPSRNHIRRSLGEGSGAGAVVLCSQVQGSPLPQVLKEDGAITAHADGDWISAEDWATSLPDAADDE